ncbi:MAG: hypothetical protein ACOYJY_00205 [Acutalibacteraceae bacterium]|jgi:hypothetical protein
MHLIEKEPPIEEEESLSPQESEPQEECPASPDPVGEEEAGTDDPAEERALIDRLADEFVALAEEMDGVAQPEDLPDEIWQTAAEGVPLRDACLRYWYAEYCRRQAAQRAAARAGAGSAGSLRDVPDDPRPEEAAFARSFRTAVN